MGDANEHRNRPGHFNWAFLCKLWVFGAHIGFVLRPMKRSESHRDESVSHRLEESKVIMLVQYAFVRQNKCS